MLKHIAQDAHMNLIQLTILPHLPEPRVAGVHACKGSEVRLVGDAERGEELRDALGVRWRDIERHDLTKNGIQRTHRGCCMDGGGVARL